MDVRPSVTFYQWLQVAGHLSSISRSTIQLKELLKDLRYIKFWSSLNKFSNRREDDAVKKKPKTFHQIRQLDNSTKPNNSTKHSPDPTGISLPVSVPKGTFALSPLYQAVTFRIHLIVSYFSCSPQATEQTEESKPVTTAEEPLWWRI